MTERNKEIGKNRERKGTGEWEREGKESAETGKGKIRQRKGKGLWQKRESKKKMDYGADREWRWVLPESIFKMQFSVHNLRSIFTK